VTARSAAAATSSGRFDHRAARERFGEPDEWEGNVNDPRTREEHGIRFNEKWIYYLPDGAQRFVYWHRYACRGVLVKEADGQLRPEPI
jgi:hypothetical protein